MIKKISENRKLRKITLATTVITMGIGLVTSLSSFDGSGSGGSGSGGSGESGTVEWFAELDVEQDCSTAETQYSQYSRETSGGGGAGANWAPYTGSASAYGSGSGKEWYTGPMIAYIQKKRTPCKTWFTQCNKVDCHPTGVVTYTKP